MDCRMLRLGVLSIVSLALWIAQSPAADAPPDFAASGLKFLEQHCTACHGGNEPKAELKLDQFRDTASVVKQRKTWDKVRRALLAGEMPPKDKPQPAAADVEAFLAHVTAVFDHADRNAPPNPGRVTMRRLNRVEYRNTVRDLLGVDFDPTEGFPADDIGHGFDNIGDVLSLSPLLMERYLEAAETISNRVIVVNPPEPASRYLSGRFLQPNNAETSQARFRVLDPASTEAVHSGPFMAPGDYLKFSADADLILRANLYAETASDAPVRVAMFLVCKDDTLPGLATPEELAQFMGANASKLKHVKIVGIYEITAREPDKVQQITYDVKRLGNIQNAGVALLNPVDGVPPAKLHIEHISTVGPLETRPASHLKILASTPGKPQAEQTQEVLTRLLRQAYRRPATADELSKMTQLVDATIAGGEKWEAGMQRVVQVLLCSPKFLFRVEQDEQPQNLEPRPLDEFQLASRLSYFLWSTMPDEELFDLAAKGELSAKLEPQVKRMLADPRSDNFVRSFAFQWLQIQRLDKFAPDAALFPAFNDALRAAMLKETELFFAAVLREDRSVLDLLDANFTFLNEPLAKLYGIADTNGNLIGQPETAPKGEVLIGPEFRRVTLQSKQRGGILTQASVLTVTSNPTRTSPVKRGRWVLEQMLGEPPPPPPPNVPELPNDATAAANATLKQRMEVHRQNPACANCHAKMDPIGFALENFDAIGQFRTKDGTFDVDATGEFADGTKFAGPDGLKTVVAQRKELFLRCLAEKLLIYATGRGIEYYDRRPVEAIVQKLNTTEPKFSLLITEIVQSDPFRRRRGIEATTADGE